MDARSAYREAATRGASGVRLVVLLYEQAIHDLRRAAISIEQGETELRTQAINHGLTIICHLQCTLDRERGGEVSRNLDRFYNSVRAQLLEAQIRVSREILNQQITFLLELREAWVHVESASAIEGRSSSRAIVRQTDDANSTPSQTVSANWEG
jgi:flagellar secretion chaperone FliS